VGKKLFTGLAALFTAVVLMLFLTAPESLELGQAVPVIGSVPDEWLAEREREAGQIRPITPGTEKRIRWYRERIHRKTAFAVVYLHGFSATRQELAPLGEIIADSLGANLFESRLAGHGHRQDALVNVHAEDWLADGVEALAVGAAIGKRLIVIGTSTGATLALAVMEHPLAAAVDSLVLISPNFGVGDPNGKYLTWPGGPQLAKLVVGETRSWEAHNELQALYWSTTYPTEALVEMMRLVDFVQDRLPLNLASNLLVFYSPDDTVIDIASMLEAYQDALAPRKKLISLRVNGDPGNHVLAGDIMAPENNALVTDQVVRFVTEGD
jgi:esterase/lipase